MKDSERRTCEFEITEEMLVDGEVNIIHLVLSGKVFHRIGMPTWAVARIRNPLTFQAFLGQVVQPFPPNNNCWCITEPGRYLLYQYENTPIGCRSEYRLSRHIGDGFAPPLLLIFNTDGTINKEPSVYHAPKKTKTITVTLEVPEGTKAIILNGKEVQL